MSEENGLVTCVDKVFDTEHLKADLKGRSVRSGVITMVAQAVKFLLQMGVTVVLARLLTPEDFGLIAMVTAITGFVGMFKSMGLSMATVQKPDITHEQISTLFWINVMLSLGIMLLIAAIAPAIAWFYGDSRLTWITLALASVFIFSGLTIQHQALLTRQMRFGRLAAIEVISNVAGVVTGIVLAWYGAGYWALVLMHAAGAITTAIGVWSACRWCPGLPVRNSGVRGMLAFGGNLTGFNIINYFGRNLDNILIGRYWGALSLGLYSKAYNLLMLPIRQIIAPISAVAIPTLSRLQDEPERYRRYYCRAISLIAFITMPLVITLAALSDEIIRIVLGEQWADTAVIFKVLAFAAMVQPVVSTTGWVYVSLGQTNRMLRWGLIGVPLIILSFVIGLPWGALGVAVSYTVCTVIFIPVPCLLFAFRLSPVNIVDFAKVVWLPLTISLVIYVVLELVGYYLKPYGLLWILLGSFIFGLGTLLLFVLTWPRVRSEAANIVSVLKMLRN